MPLVLFKPITPKKLNDKAMYKELMAEAQAVSKDVLLDFDLSVATWKRKVKFVRIVDTGPNSIDFLVGTDDKIFGYVDKGTVPHIIRPKRAKVLRFKTGGKPKTVPNIIASGFGSPGTNEVFAHEVFHPGTKPRNIVKTITKKWKPLYKSRMEKAMKRVAKASGHAM